MRQKRWWWLLQKTAEANLGLKVEMDNGRELSALAEESRGRERQRLPGQSAFVA